MIQKHPERADEIREKYERKRKHLKAKRERRHERVEKKHERHRNHIQARRENGQNGKSRGRKHFGREGQGR
ncbi:MAG: hypothetical protein QF619_02875 [Candidatus Binatia bacterium]|nr:hypothetical protein [Candidatus Binatia bacterium]